MHGLDFGVGTHLVAHEWLVMARGIAAVVELPTVATEVAEAGEFAAEVRACLTSTGCAHSVLQVRVNLNLEKKKLSRILSITSRY